MTQTEERVAPAGPVDTGRALGLVALLPAGPGQRVGCVATDDLAAALARSYPGLVRLDGPAEAAAGSLEVLVVDTRLRPVEPLLPLLTPGGVLVTIGARGEHVVCPGLESTEQIWRRGWPLPDVVGAGAQLRRDVTLRLGAMRLPRMEISGGPYVSLADRVAAGLSRLVGERLELVGIVTATRLVLRLRGRREYAVRFALTPDEAPVATPTVARDVPALAPMLPTEIASGHLHGHAWTATAWVPRRHLPVLNAWRRSRRHAADAGALADALAGTVTGTTGAGWAEAWLDAVPQVPESARPAYLTALRRLEAGLPTGWCHGDPWPGNILLGRSGPMVIDWDNAAPDAPLGLDRVLLAAQQRQRRSGSTLARACADLADRPSLLARSVAGRAWPEWDRPTRAALVLAAFLVHLRGRPGERPGGRALPEELSVLHGLVTAPAEEDDARPGERRTALRGALWLGLGALVAKASQTVVLLVLATILAPSAMGMLAIGSLVLNAATAFTDLGSSTALVYWRGDAERAARSALTIALGTGLLLLAGGWLLAPALAAALHTGPDGVRVVRGLILALPFGAVAGVSRELMRREMAFARRVMPDIVSALVSVPVALVAAERGHGVDALIACQLVQSTLTMLLCWCARRPVRPGWRRSDAAGLVAYGRHLAGANIVQLLMLNVDYLIVARVLGPGPLGQYSIAFRLAYMPYLLGAVVIGGAAFPYLCRLRGGELGRSAEEVCVLTLTLLMPLYVGMGLLAPQLRLLGDQWAPAVPAVPWLAAYGLTLSVVQMCQVPLNSVSRTRDTLVVSLLHLVLLAGLLLALTRYGVGAVAVAQCIASAVTAVVALAVARRRVAGLRPGAILAGLGPAVLGAAAMAVVVAVTDVLLPGTRVSLPGLLIVGVLGLAAYTAPVWALRRTGPIGRVLGGGS